jgi:imidazoleglycerol phosphate dehydratase HisB
MLTIVWNTNGFHIINLLSKGIKFNAHHFVPDAAIPLGEWFKTQIGRTDRKLIIRADNACPHPAKMSLDFLELIGVEKHLIHRTHLIWHRLISVSSARPSSS